MSVRFITTRIAEIYASSLSFAAACVHARTFSSSNRAVVVTILIVGTNGKLVMLPLPVMK